MKTPSRKQQTPRSRSTTLYKTLLLGAAAGLAALTSARAGNILQNPSFESGSGLANWTAQEVQTWPIGPASGQGKLYHNGANSLWMQGEYGQGGGTASYIYEYQTVACAAGSTFSADAFFSQYVNHDGTVHEGGDNGTSGLFTADGSGQEDGWIEVAFLDSSNHILADYRSVIVDPAYVNNLVNIGATTTIGAQTILTWLDCQVTNQYDVSQIPAGAVDPDSYATAITNTLSSGQYMVAPPGTVNVQFRLALFQAAYESGATYWDDATLNQVSGAAPSVISNVSPDGSHFFNSAAGGFTFTVASASAGGSPLPDNPTNGVRVVVNGTDQSASLRFSGNTKNWNVTLPTITSNQLYNISITVSNSAGLKTTDNLTFDTFNTNAFIVYAEDYDFNGGQFVQNPVPTNGTAANSYWGTAGTPGVDFNYVGGGSTLAPAYPNRTDNAVDFQVSTDLQMPLYTAQSNSAIYNVNISYNNAGNWLNYTRNPYPSGASIVFARISGGNGYGVEYLNILTGGYGTSAQTTNRLGQFVLANGTDWGAYRWIPMTDALGNIAVINIPSGQQTLQLLSGGGENVIDFLIVPAGSVALPPVVANFNPPITSQNIFLGGTTNITFSVSSSQATIATSNIVVTLNGTTVPATFTGNNTNWNGSVAIPQNQVLTLGISATDANGLNKSVSYSFDTFSQSNFVFEAEDYDFNNGQFIDNPIPTGNANLALATLDANSYYYYPANNGANAAVAGVDYSTSQDSGEQYVYRPLDLAGTEVSSDAVRAKFIVSGGSQTNSDYDIGWWNPGQWFNYTRTYPSGTFNVWGRLASGNPFSGVTLSLVTSGQGTANQTTQTLGTFSDSTANGWQNWHWVPLVDTNGHTVTVTLGGVQTLRSTGGTGQNANFYMLVPATVVAQPPTLAVTISQGKLVIKISTQNGVNYTVLYNNTLNGGTWQPLGSVIPGTGATVTVSNSIPVSPGQLFYKVLAQ